MEVPLEGEKQIRKQVVPSKSLYANKDKENAFEAILQKKAPSRETNREKKMLVFAALNRAISGLAVIVSFSCSSNTSIIDCDRWFHPRCINMNDEQFKQAQSRDKFYCPDCEKIEDKDKSKRGYKRQAR